MKTIAILDNDKSLLNDIEGKLSEYNVLKFSKSLDLISYIDENGQDSLDLLILDLIISEKTIDVLEKKSFFKDAMVQIPILFLSAINDDKKLSKVYQLRDRIIAVDYMAKPVSTLWFLDKVKKLIQLKSFYKKMIKISGEKTGDNVNMIYLVKKYIANTEELEKELNNRRENEQKSCDLCRQLDLVKKLITKIATNDIPLLKFALVVIEKNRFVIDSIIKEASEDDELFRVLTKTIEPLQTAIADIEQVLRIFIDMRIIDCISVTEDDLKKSSFYNILDSIYLNGGFSHQLFESFLELAKINNEDSNIINL